MRNDKIDIDLRTYNLALRVLDVVDEIPNNHSGRVVARQLARSGTSIGANVEESRASESRPDFIHKLSIALKEARETYYWLRIVKDKKFIQSESIDLLLKESDEIRKILGASVKTAKSKKS